MKRMMWLMLALALVLSLCACGSKAETAPAEEAPVEGVPVEEVPTWQEQYDLGVRYLSEGNYKEAIIAFEAAIKIDPKLPKAYLGLADVYTAQGDTDKAMEILQQALEALGEDESLSAALEALQPAGPQPLEGYPKTERRDDDDGSYSLVEYNEYGKDVRVSHYAADGTLEDYIIRTYTEDLWLVSGSYYNAGGEWRYDRFYDIEGEKRGIYNREIKVGTVYEYLYTPDSPQVTILDHRDDGDISFHYTMQDAGNRVELVFSSSDAIQIQEFGGSWGGTFVCEVWIDRNGNPVDDPYT